MSSTATTETRLQQAPGQESPLNGGPVAATLFFYDPPADGSKPYNFVEPQAEGTAQKNFGAVEHEVRIADLRGKETAFSLDTNAFAVVRATGSPGVDFASDASIRTAYYPEVEQVLRQHIAGASKVVIFDHTLRKADPGADRAPVMYAHVDQVPASAAQRVRLHLPPDEAERRLQGRFRIVNVWRPLNGPVESFPLAVADSPSVPDDCIVAVEHRYPDRTGYTAAVRHPDDARWWYLSAMRNDERFLLQCFDSVGGARVPHTAFVDPRSTPASRPRESIEVRALVFED